MHRSTTIIPATGARRSLPLLPWLAGLSAVVLMLATLGAGLMLAQLIERTTLVRDSDTTTQLLNSIVQVEGATGFFLHGDRQAASGNIEEFFVHLGNLPNVLRTNAYGFNREILWSSEPDLIGRRFLDNPELDAAFRGEPVINSGIVGAPSEKAEHEELGEVGAQYVENYLPIWGKRPGEPPVVGVIEIYRTPVGLFAAIQQSATRAWLGAGAVALAVYVILVGMVWRAQCLVRLQQAALVTTEKLATAGEMASAVAHGLRNPVASIRSSAELGLEIEPAADTRALLAEIMAQADRLEGWIRQYLASARAGASADTPAEPRAVIAASLAQYRPAFTRQGVRLILDVPDRLPLVRLHPVILGQLLNSVLANAAEASGNDGEIEVRARRSGRDRLVIEVQDQGPGMSGEEIARAFEPFVTSKPSGLGLGLPIARETLERHGGHLAFASTAGIGTTVGLDLPIVAETPS